MTIPPDPGVPPGGSPPPGSRPPSHIAGPPPPQQGISTTAKVLIGCGVAAVLVLVLMVAVFGVGAWFLDRQLGDADAGLARQAEITRQLTALERERVFEPPANGVIAAERAALFFRITDDAFETTRDFYADIQRRTDEADGRRPTLGDAMGAVRGLGRARVVLGESLLEHGMPTTEYMWTGLALLHAYERRGQSPEESGVPAQNLELARRHEATLRDVARGEREDQITRSAIFGVAMTLILEGDMHQRMAGWDTLRAAMP